MSEALRFELDTAPFEQKLLEAEEQLKRFREEEKINTVSKPLPNENRIAESAWTVHGVSSHQVLSNENRTAGSSPLPRNDFSSKGIAEEQLPSGQEHVQENREKGSGEYGIPQKMYAETAGEQVPSDQKHVQKNRDMESGEYSLPKDVYEIRYNAEKNPVPYQDRTVSPLQDPLKELLSQCTRNTSLLEQILEVLREIRKGQEESAQGQTEDELEFVDSF